MGGHIVQVLGRGTAFGPRYWAKVKVTGYKFAVKKGTRTRYEALGTIMLTWLKILQICTLAAW